MINKNSSVKNMFFSGIKPFNSKQKSNPSYKSGVYSSIDSFKLKNFQKKNQSNIPPTIDVTDNYNSPIKSEINSNELNSAKKYKLKSELKTVFEIKNSKLKEIFNKDKKSISTDKQQSLSKKNSKKEENIKDNEGEKNLLDTDSEISLHSYKPEEKISPRLHHDYYSSFLDKNRAIRQERLLQSSIDFYLHQGRYRNQLINYKREGNGKYIWEDGEYYIGQFKNGVANGKGIIYYSNGNIRYEGDWIIGKKEGYGKLILKNGEYYIGQFKNDLANGKGILYYSNGNIKYEGNWINDEFVGN